mmetsp:Transcript_9209/g.13944  ORF Transcript_9209/g.13944 Transcript_9209/m.13944 type:complete len:204 (+) Transcript_9209:206-817(+)
MSSSISHSSDNISVTRVSSMGCILVHEFFHHFLVSSGGHSLHDLSALFDGRKKSFHIGGFQPQNRKGHSLREVNRLFHKRDKPLRSVINQIIHNTSVSQSVSLRDCSGSRRETSPPPPSSSSNVIQSKSKNVFFRNNLRPFSQKASLHDLIIKLESDIQGKNLSSHFLQSVAPLANPLVPHFLSHSLNHIAASMTHCFMEGCD